MTDVVPTLGVSAPARNAFLRDVLQKHVHRVAVRPDLEPADTEALDALVVERDSPLRRLERADLPVEEVRQLREPAPREHFVTRVFARARWRALLASSPRAAELVEFHARHKMLLLAHRPSTYAALGRIVSGAGRGRIGTRLEDYGTGFFRALAERATGARHVNALQHLAGFVKESLEESERGEWAGILEGYRRGLFPLVVPLGFLQQLLRRHVPGSWATKQVYLAPYPREIGLRDAV